MNARRVSVLAASLATAFACGGSTGSPAGGTASQTEAQWCDARQSRAAKCAVDSGVAPSFDRAKCGREYRCTVAVAAAPDAYFACRTNADCSAKTSGDYCEAQSAVGRTSPGAETCAKKYAECKAAGGATFSDETCSLAAERDDVAAKVLACVDGPCDQVSDCVKALKKAVAPDC